VKVLSEDLQDAYERLVDQRDKAMEYDEIAQESRGQNLKDVENYERAKGKAITDSINFWLSVSERYKLWGKNVGIRDGYTLVEVPTPLKGLFDQISGGEL
jgi:hypothetical protein